MYPGYTMGQPDSELREALKTAGLDAIRALADIAENGGSGADTRVSAATFLVGTALAVTQTYPDEGGTVSS